MQSWLMKLWLGYHGKDEWPDLSISQPDDASHVTKEENRPSQDDIKKMCSDDFFAEHEYGYQIISEVRAIQRPLPIPPPFPIPIPKEGDRDHNVQRETEDEDPYAIIPIPCTSGSMRESTVAASTLNTTDSYEMLSELRPTQLPLPIPPPIPISIPPLAQNDIKGDRDYTVPGGTEYEDPYEDPTLYTSGFIRESTVAVSALDTKDSYEMLSEVSAPRRRRPMPTPRSTGVAKEDPKSDQDQNVSGEMEDEETYVTMPPTCTSAPVKHEGDYTVNESRHLQHKEQSRKAPKPLPRTIRFV